MRMFRHKIMEEKFIEDKPVTVCLLKAEINLQELRTYFADDTMKWLNTHPSVKAVWIHDRIKVTIVGKATCSDKDVFDRTGRYLAESKAKTKLYQFIETLSNKAYKDAMEYASGYKTASIWYRRLKEFESKHTEDLINEGSDNTEL